MTLRWTNLLEEVEPTVEEAEAARWERQRYRPHCGSCGRFVPNKTLHSIKHWETGELIEQTATCTVCGPNVVAVWPD